VINSGEINQCSGIFTLEKIFDPLTSDFSGYFSGSKFGMNQRFSVTPSVNLLGGWTPLIELACLYDSASDPAQGLDTALRLGMSSRLRL
jgi:hypothetical protein